MINEKLELLNLSKEERKKVEDKFLATLALVSIEELQEIINLLQANGIYITKAREIKVLGNSKEEITKKFSILKELGEVAIYKQDPTKINYNVIDVYKKIQCCKQIGKSYKKEDGTYENFLFNEGLWQLATVKQEETIPAFNQVEEEIVSMTPEVAPVNNDVVEDKYTDIEEYMANDKSSEIKEEKTTTFDIIQDELETQNLENNISKLNENRKALEDFQKQLSELDTISFDDLDFGTESFGGR